MRYLKRRFLMYNPAIFFRTHNAGLLSNVYPEEVGQDSSTNLC